MWPDTRIQDLFGIELPIIQAPMAGANLAEMAIAVAEAGGLGSLPCALLTPDRLRAEFGRIRDRTSARSTSTSSAIGRPNRTLSARRHGSRRSRATTLNSGWPPTPRSPPRAQKALRFEVAETMGRAKAVDAEAGLYKYFRPIVIDGDANADLLDVVAFNYGKATAFSMEGAEVAGHDVTSITITDRDISDVRVTSRGP